MGSFVAAALRRITSDSSTPRPTQAAHGGFVRRGHPVDDKVGFASDARKCTGAPEMMLEQRSVAVGSFGKGPHHGH